MYVLLSRRQSHISEDLSLPWEIRHSGGKRCTDTECTNNTIFGTVSCVLKVFITAKGHERLGNVLKSIVQLNDCNIVHVATL